MENNGKQNPESGFRFDLDDREMLSQARDLASSYGYTVLQAIQEWHRSKGSSKAMPLGEVIEKLLAAKSNRSAAYMDKLNADMRLFQSHFGADRPSIINIGTVASSITPSNSDISHNDHRCRVRTPIFNPPCPKTTTVPHSG